MPDLKAKHTARELCQRVIDREPGYIRGQPASVRRRWHRFQAYSDTEPPKPHQVREFKWMFANGRPKWLRRHEEKLLRQALKDDRTERGWAKRLAWLRHMKFIREDNIL